MVNGISSRVRCSYLTPAQDFVVQHCNSREVAVDSILRNALNMRQKLKTELLDIENFIRVYQHLRTIESPQQSLELESSEPEQALESANFVQPVSDSDESRVHVPESAAMARRGYTKEMLKPHVRKLLLDAGTPLTRTQLLRALDARDIPVGGSNRPKNMGTIMWRLSDHFVNLDGFGYWPKDTPYAPASYVPEPPIDGPMGDSRSAPSETQQHL
jgi:hypothetical protein